MIGTTKAAQRETVPISFSDKRVFAFEAASVIPIGYKQATLREVALRYRYDADFRKELHENGEAWISQKGLGTSRYHQIKENGRFIKPDKQFVDLPPEERSYHYLGSGFVRVGAVRFDGHRGWLSVNARTRPSDVARVAYVLDDGKTAASKIGSELFASFRSTIADAVRRVFRAPD